MISNEEILTLEEASQLLRISKEALYQYARGGRIPAKKVGRQWRFIRTQVINWLEGKF